MIYQFIYGRKNEGYCQINKEHTMPFQKSDLIKFESLKSYSFSSEIEKMDLPQSYYFYNDETSCGKIGIVGKTSYVPGRTSRESGDRDTSFLHKYIFIDDDYQKVLQNPKELYKEKIFYNNIDEYNEKKDFIYIEEEQTESKSNADLFFNEFSIHKEMLEKFIYCCLEVFSRYDKRIYCFLPSNNRSGSDMVLRLMKLIINALPPCIISGAGYLTYSPTFHNAISNPIPGNISVVFIPRNEENLRETKNEQEYNYIFDFKNHISPQVTISKIANLIINNIIQCIYTQNYKIIKSIYDKLGKFVYQYNPVDSGFLGAFYLYYKIICELKDNTPNNINHAERVVLALKNLSKYQDDITDYGNTVIITVIKVLLSRIDYSEKGLELVGAIYDSYRLCKNIVIQALSYKCLESINERNFDRLFLIVNYPFHNEEIKNLFIEYMYSNKEYYPVALKIVANTLYSFTSSKLATEKKIVKVFEAVDSLYQQYPELAKTEEFIANIEDTINIILEEDVDSLVGAADGLHKSINSLIERYPDCDAYKTISQNICYKVMKDVMVLKYEIDAKDVMDVFYVWCNELFEKNDRLVKKVMCIVEDERFAKTLNTNDPIQITKLLQKYILNQAEIERICKKYMKEICDVIGNYNGEDSDHYFNMFQYLLLSYHRLIYYKIVFKVMSLNWVSGIHDFYNYLVQNKKLNNEMKRILIDCIHEFIDESDYKRKLSVDDNCFLEELGIEYKKKGNKLFEIFNGNKESKVQRNLLKKK